MANLQVHTRARGEELDARAQAVSAGLLAIRIASAAHRLRSGDPLTSSDRSILHNVIRDLRQEAHILRNGDTPDVLDETAYAFAGLALSTIPDRKRDIEPEAAASALESLAEQLTTFLDPATHDASKLELIESAFLRAGRRVGSEVGQPGERVDGQLEFETAR